MFMFMKQCYHMLTWIHIVFEIDMNWVYYYCHYYDNILVYLLICILFYAFTFSWFLILISHYFMCHRYFSPEANWYISYILYELILYSEILESITKRIWRHRREHTPAYEVIYYHNKTSNNTCPLHISFKDYMHLSESMTTLLHKT